MDYLKVSQNILKYIGGEENVKQVSHCYTRLRFSLVDSSKVNTEEIEKIKGVIGVSDSGGQYQVIIGTEVNKIYAELEKSLGKNNMTKPNKGEKNKKSIKQYLNTVLDVFISCFTPIIPVIAGSGMIKVLCSILLTFNFISDKSSTYQILSIVGDAVYYFLPFFVAYTAAKKMDTDPFIAMVLAAILLHPNLATLGAEGEGHSSFMSIGFRIINYSSQALPVILSVYVMKYIDKISDKICPNLVKIFLKPMITLLIMSPIMLIIIAPSGAILGDYFAKFIDIMNQWGWIAVGLNALLFPLLVLTGMHNALIPLIITMFSTQGFDTILIPSGLVANIAQAGAAGAVYFKSKNKELKGTALSASVSALIGITEPALYGVNLRLKRPFKAVLLGALITGCITGALNVTAYSFVSPSLLSLPIFIGAEKFSFVGAIISAVLAFAITFGITLILGFNDIDQDEKEINENESINESHIETVASPIEGNVISLKAVNDKAFSSEQIGKGFAIQPSDGDVVAPFDGEVMAMFPTKHAIGIKRNDGLELLIHIGLDTVNLNGKYFESFVSVGDKFKAGDLLIKFELEKIKEAGYDITTPIIITNSNQYDNIEILNKSKIKKCEGVINVG